MKRLITALVIVMLLACCANTQAGPTIITQQYHVEGYFSSPDEPEYESYNITDKSPISGLVHSIMTDDLYGSSSAYVLGVSAATNASLPDPLAYGAAEGDWIFFPQANSYQLRLQIDVANLRHEDPIQVLLEDVTAQSQMFYCNAAAGDWLSPTTMSFSVDPAHQYHMYAYISSSAENDGPWSGSIQAVIPAPAAILLGSIGVYTVAWLRRRKML